MSSPIAIYIRNLRVQTGLTQLDMAGLMGYEQAYVSAIELGIKSPSDEFIAKLIIALKLGTKDQEEIGLALKDSKRRYTLPPEVSTKTYLFCSAFWERIEHLHPALLDAMYEMLKAGDKVAERPIYRPTRVRRQSKREAPM
jgi:transcriptional regulator with XRE-family HTH domain